MEDLRKEFIQNLEKSLVADLDPEQLDTVTAKAIMILNNYEITERCTELIPLADENTRILDNYCACLAVDGKAKSTIKAYHTMLKRLEETVGKPYTQMITYDIRYFLATMKQRGLANSSIENARSYVSAFFAWMTSEEIIPKDITAQIHTISVPHEIREAFSDVEIDALRSGCRGLKERALIEFLLATGVRVNELSTMDIDDVDFHSMTVHVKHGKGSKERVTYISSIAKKHLMAYLEDRKDESVALIQNYRHERITNGGIRSILKTIADRAGVEDVHPHRFRRTFTTKLAARGMEVQEIQQLLGHTNINTTMKYIQINASQVQASYRRFIA